MTLFSTKFREDIQTKICWFASNIASSGCHPIAYFSAEYGLQHSLPFYAGGLGFLAGDYIKECSDLGIPMVAVGFMYPEGYLRQKIRVDGWQEDIDEVLDRDATPIVRVLDEKGEQLDCEGPFCRSAYLRSCLEGRHRKGASVSHGHRH